MTALVSYVVSYVSALSACSDFHDRSIECVSWELERHLNGNFDCGIRASLSVSKEAILKAEA